ncbi:cytochrome c oxidase, subunit VIa [Dendryphion nanum]|uniref:Cytochrome c oxidase subunit n=1 Tax=Dendryphion nanum TaxID=256645 RepID=A0A9P9INF1_9PLEO|nr:cytochrome c oxidase, subunit VIa [Dendryphion nanum]
MLAQRMLYRSTARLGLARTAIVRRNYSSETPKQFAGTEDNEFNRERAHANEHAAESGELWRKLSVYVAIPCLILATINAKLRWDAHQEHAKHAPALEDKVEYPYQNIRTKNFWWGDGDKTLFWNEKVNYHKRDE